MATWPPMVLLMACPLISSTCSLLLLAVIRIVLLAAPALKWRTTARIPRIASALLADLFHLCARIARAAVHPVRLALVQVADALCIVVWTRFQAIGLLIVTSALFCSIHLFLLSILVKLTPFLQLLLATGRIPPGISVCPGSGKECLAGKVPLEAGP